MRYIAMVAAATFGMSLLPATADDEAEPSCAEIAERRAARQFIEEDAARMDRQAGQMRDSALQRDLLKLQAESYREKVYRDCLRSRARPDEGQEPAPPDE